MLCLKRFGALKLGTALPQPAPTSPFDLAAYDYDLPSELIAQQPLADRDAARMMALDRTSGELTHRGVGDLPRLLRPGDVLVLNDTRVRPARLRGETDTGAKFELLLLRLMEDESWECLGRPAKRLPPGRRLFFPGSATGTVIRVGDGRVVVSFDAASGVDALLEAHGEIPLPPYIHRPHGAEPSDRERYQTVYARVPGAVAAPTAGLHLTPLLLDRLRRGGVEVVSITLHVGPGTFQPVREADVRRHRMEREWVDIPAATARVLARAKRDGRRVIAVGTTTTRALESRAAPDGLVRSGAGWAEGFIMPGYELRVVDGLLTNFHLPRSTLLLLVAAVAGREAILAAYREAVRQRYRFYSYGDAMIILDHV